MPANAARCPCNWLEFRAVAAQFLGRRLLARCRRRSHFTTRSTSAALFVMAEAKEISAGQAFLPVRGGEQECLPLLNVETMASYPV